MWAPSAELVGAIVIWRLGMLHKSAMAENSAANALTALMKKTDVDLLLRRIAAERCVSLPLDVRQPFTAPFAIGFRALITGAAGRAEHVDLAFRCRIVPYEAGDARQL